MGIDLYNWRYLHRLHKLSKLTICLIYTKFYSFKHNILSNKGWNESRSFYRKEIKTHSSFF